MPRRPAGWKPIKKGDTSRIQRPFKEESVHLEGKRTTYENIPAPKSTTFTTPSPSELQRCNELEQLHLLARR